MRYVPYNNIYDEIDKNTFEYLKGLEKNYFNTTHIDPEKIRFELLVKGKREWWIPVVAKIENVEDRDHLTLKGSPDETIWYLKGEYLPPSNGVYPNICGVRLMGENGLIGSVSKFGPFEGWNNPKIVLNIHWNIFYNRGKENENF